LMLDDSMPIAEEAKAALLRGNQSRSRRYLLPLMRPFILVFFLLVLAFRMVSPRWPHMPKTLHQVIYWGLKTFATPDANRLVLRHFIIGTEILQFIRDNAGVEAPTVPLSPRTLEELKPDTFLQHDLNIYNFVIGLNAELKAQGRKLASPKQIDYSAISDGPVELEPLPKGRFNHVDIQTAIEAYTPVYGLFLSRRDFVRAANSLQLDETIGIYLAQILGDDYHLSLINNHHPMVPLSLFETGFRLMMHGYDAEALHGYLRMRKRMAAGETVADTPQSVLAGS
ncbi:MAG: hypothetical protein AAGA69_02995, partial [Pseudomonadota bacterium]